MVAQHLFLNYFPTAQQVINSKNMKHIPYFVLDYLVTNQFIGKTRTLIVGENYPGTNYANSYFYRSIPGCPHGAPSGPTPQFFIKLCDTFLIPSLDSTSRTLSEPDRLKKFLENRFLLIDAQENLKAPTRPATLTPIEIDDLVKTIILINPSNILFLSENNKNIISLISGHPLYYIIKPKIVINHLRKGRLWFSFPSPPANPKLFQDEIEFARQYYFF